MTLVSLLLLAGQVAAGPERSTPTSPGSGASQTAPPTSTLAAPFEVARLEWWRPLLKGPFRLARGPQLGAGASQEPSDTPEVGDVAARVVCTMRVIKASPAVDPGFVVPLPSGPIDAIARDDLSPCTEQR
jgi:hypothetical protein